MHWSSGRRISKMELRSLGVKILLVAASRVNNTTGRNGVEGFVQKFEAGQAIGGRLFSGSSPNGASMGPGRLQLVAFAVFPGGRPAGAVLREPNEMCVREMERWVTLYPHGAPPAAESAARYAELQSRLAGKLPPLNVHGHDTATFFAECVQLEQAWAATPEGIAAAVAVAEASAAAAAADLAARMTAPWDGTLRSIKLRFTGIPRPDARLAARLAAAGAIVTESAKFDVLVYDPSKLTNKYEAAVGQKVVLTFSALLERLDQLEASAAGAGSGGGSGRGGGANHGGLGGGARGDASGGSGDENAGSSSPFRAKRCYQVIDDDDDDDDDGE